MKKFATLFLLAALLCVGNTIWAGNGPTLPANARTLLVGTWISAEDADNSIVITTQTYTEKYAGQPDDTRKLTFLDHACGTKKPAKPSKELYLRTVSSTDAEDEMCFYVVAVSATGLELSPVGGRGNTLKFKRQ